MKRRAYLLLVICILASLLLEFCQSLDLRPICKNLKYEKTTKERQSLTSAVLKSIARTGAQGVRFTRDDCGETPGLEFASVTMVSTGDTVIFYVESIYKEIIKDKQLSVNLRIPFKAKSVVMPVIQVEYKGKKEVVPILSKPFDLKKSDTSYSLTLSLAEGVQRKVVYIAICSMHNEEDQLLIFEGCKTVLETDQEIRCKCNGPEDTEQSQNIYPCLVLITFLFFVALSFAYFYAKLSRSDEKVGGDRHIFMNCSHRTAKFLYVMTLRIGSPSDDYDLKSTLIQFELLDEDKVAAANGRIRPESILEDDIAEVKYYIHRLTLLKDKNLFRIRFQLIDGVPDSEIYFYGIVFDDNQAKKRRYIPVNKYIRSETKSNTMLAPDEKLLASNHPSPKLLLPQLSVIDIHFIFYFVVNWVALFCLLLPKTVKIESLTDAILATCCGIALGLPVQCLLILGFRHFIKQEEVRQRLVHGLETSQWTTILNFFLFMLLMVGIAITTIITYMTFTQTYIEMIYWLSATLNACVIVIGCWACCRANRSYTKLMNKCRPKKAEPAGGSAVSGVGSSISLGSESTISSAPSASSQVEARKSGLALNQGSNMSAADSTSEIDTQTGVFGPARKVEPQPPAK